MADTGERLSVFARVWRNMCWLSVALGSLGLQLLSTGISSIFSVMMVDLLHSFNCTDLEAFAVGSCQMSSMCISGFFAVPAIRKFGFRKTGICGSVIGSLGFGTSYFVSHIYVLYFTYGILSGVGIGFMMFSAMVCVQQFYTKQRALLVGIASSGAGFGMLLIGLMASTLTNKGWRYMAGGNCLFTFVLGCLCSMLLKSPAEPQQSDHPLSEIETQKQAVSEAAHKSTKTTNAKSSLSLAGHNSTGTSLFQRSISQEETESSNSGDISTTKYNTPFPGHNSTRTSLFQRSISKEEDASSTTRDVSAAKTNRSSLGHNSTGTSLFQRSISKEEGESSNSRDKSTTKHSMSSPGVSSVTGTGEFSLQRSISEEEVNIDETAFSSTENNPSDTVDNETKPNRIRFPSKTLCVKLIPFILFVVNNFVNLLAVFLPDTYIIEVATTYNISYLDASYLKLVSASTNIISRIVSGIIAYNFTKQRYAILGCVYTLFGVLLLLTPAACMYETLVLYSGTFGILQGAVCAMYPVVLFDMVGAEAYDNRLQIILASTVVAYLLSCVPVYFIDWLNIVWLIQLAGLLNVIATFTAYFAIEWKCVRTMTSQKQ